AGIGEADFAKLEAHGPGKIPRNGIRWRPGIVHISCPVDSKFVVESNPHDDRPPYSLHLNDRPDRGSFRMPKRGAIPRPPGFPPPAGFLHHPAYPRAAAIALHTPLPPPSPPRKSR